MKERASVTEPVRLLDGAGDGAEIALLRAATSTPPAAARARAIALFESGRAKPAEVARAAGRGATRSHWSWIGWSSLGVTLIVGGLLFSRVSSDSPAPEEVWGAAAPASSAATADDPSVSPEAAPAPVTATAAPARGDDPSVVPDVAKAVPAPGTATAAPAPSSPEADERERTPVVSVAALPSVASSSATRPPVHAIGSSTPAPETRPDAPTANLLAEEVAALDRARRALRAGDTTGAQNALADYERRFPAGVLAPEATLLRVEALLAAGDEAAARRIGEDFLAKGQGGAYVGRMRSLLQSAAHAK